MVLWYKCTTLIYTSDTTCVCTYLYFYIYICINIYVYIHTPHIHTYIHTYIYIHIYIYMYVCMYVCIFIYIYLFTHIFYTLTPCIYLYMQKEGERARERERKREGERGREKGDRDNEKRVFVRAYRYTIYLTCLLRSLRLETAGDILLLQQRKNLPTQSKVRVATCWRCSLGDLSVSVLPGRGGREGTLRS